MEKAHIFYEEYGPIDLKLQEQIASVLHADKQEFQPSLVYESGSQEKKLDKEKRNSAFKLISTPELFELCDRYVQKINEVRQGSDSPPRKRQKTQSEEKPRKSTKYHLYKNDVTFIRYEEGEFFKSHEDYLSLTSNLIEEYTLIMCVDGSCSGGETKLFINESGVYHSKSTKTKFHCLIFRKDINHEGAEITNGFKEIMTLNLWSIKEQKESEKIVIIRFPNDKRTHAIELNDVQKFPESKINIEINKIENKDQQQIFTYIEQNLSYEEFFVFEKIFIGESISSLDFEKNKEKILSYGFKIDQLMVKNYLEPFIIPDKESALQVLDNDTYFTSDDDFNSASSGMEEYLEESFINIKYLYLRKQIPRDNNIIILDNYSKYIEAIHFIKSHKLPFIPFKVLFTEGTLLCGGGSTGDPASTLKMIPSFASFGELNQTMFLQNLLTLSFEPLPYKQKMKNCLNYDLIPKDGHFVIESESQIYTDMNYHIRGESLFFDLAASIDNNIIPCIVDEISGLHCRLIREVDSPKEKLQFYDIDENNKMVIQPGTQRKAVYDRVNESHLFEQILSQINNIHFDISQHTQKAGIAHTFCNETVYGNMNLLMVYGMMNMNPNPNPKTSD